MLRRLVIAPTNSIVSTFETDSATGRMYPAPTHSDDSAAGLGAPGGERVDRRLWRSKGDERVAAVEKIEDQRKPEDFFGYRNRIAPYEGKFPFMTAIVFAKNRLCPVGQRRFCVCFLIRLRRGRGM